MKNTHESEIDYKETAEKAMMYCLVPEIMEQLENIRRKPIARSTVYRAFELGPTTPTQKLVLQVAKMKIQERERNPVPATEA
jgi:hypothetical protein